jgi:hypothetical protein
MIVNKVSHPNSLFNLILSNTKAGYILALIQTKKQYLTLFFVNRTLALKETTNSTKHPKKQKLQ